MCLGIDLFKDNIGVCQFVNLFILFIYVRVNYLCCVLYECVTVKFFFKY